MREKIQSIVNQLNLASKAYYSGQSEIMTNYEWDSLFDELVKLEKETGIILPDSPTQKVSENNISENKILHKFPALSLQKTKDINEIVKWSESKPVWMSWKLDGLTLVATYEKVNDNLSKLKTLATRGTGLVGSNVTHLAKHISGLPMTIDDGVNLIVRGEAVCSYKDFEEINQNNQFANPRNMASGSMTLLDENEFSKRRIHFVAFTLVDIDKDIPSWGDRINYLDTLGFETVERKACIANDILTAKDDFTKKVETNNCVYPVDGLVVVYDDVDYSNSGSKTNHHSNRGGIAFKWADESVVSTIKYIDWYCSTNSINPVAVFEPVDILGSTVQRASLHNLSELKRLNIGSKGTIIEVIKANMIIPQVVNVIEKGDEIKIPKTCPCCGEPTRINVSDSGTETLLCTNQNCGAKNLSKLTRFVSKACMDIDGLSEATLNTFVNKGFIKSYVDIFKLNKHYNELLELDGFGKKSIDNLMTAIEKARTVESNRFLNALSIPMCGGTISKDLMTKFTFNEFIDMMLTGNENTLASIDGFGPEKSKTIFSWFDNKENVQILNELISVLNIVDITNEIVSNKLENLIFAITGSVYQFKNRDELKEYIEKNGGKVSGISNKTSYLINNDIASMSSKNKKAKELNIPIISEEEFIERFGK